MSDDLTLKEAFLLLLDAVQVRMERDLTDEEISFIQFAFDCGRQWQAGPVEIEEIEAV